MMENSESASIYRFDIFEVSPDRRTQKEGCARPAQEQPFQLLLLLLENDGEIVRREGIRQRLWPSKRIRGLRRFLQLWRRQS